MRNTIRGQTETAIALSAARYILSLAGAVTALAALAGLSGGYSDSGPTTTRPARQIEQRAYGAPERHNPIYFLVNTADDADRALLYLDNARGESGLLPPYELVFGRTPAERANQEELIEGAAAAWGPDAAPVVDLRGSGTASKRD